MVENAGNFFSLKEKPNVANKIFPHLIQSLFRIFQNEDNPTLFWVILGIVLILAFLFLMAVTYYCCPGLCKPW